MKLLKFYESKGQFYSAGNVMMKLASENERECQYDQAIENYSKAVDYFQMDKSSNKNHVNTCLLKKADLMCFKNKPEAKTEAKEVKIINYDKDLPKCSFRISEYSSIEIKR